MTDIPVPAVIFDWLTTWKSPELLLQEFGLEPDKNYTNEDIKLILPKILLLLVITYLKEDIEKAPIKQVVTNALASNPCFIVENCSLIEVLHSIKLCYPNFRYVLAIDDSQQAINDCIIEGLQPVLDQLPQDIRPYFIPTAIFCEFYLLTSTVPITPECLGLLKVADVLAQTEQVLRRSFHCFEIFQETLDCETPDEFVSSLRMVPQKLQLESMCTDLPTLRQKYM